MSRRPFFDATVPAATVPAAVAPAAVALLAVGALCAATPAVAQTAASGPRASDHPALHLLVVSGLGGTPAYAETFHARAAALVDAAEARGLPAQRIAWLAEDPSRAPDRVAARGTREALQAELAALAGRAGPDDRVLVVLIGHGTGAGDESKLNLPGPDLTAVDLAGWLAALPTQTVAVVNTASASGGFVGPLSGERRIVVTATRSPREAEWTHFPEFFIEAVSGDAADTDKDERVSLLEAFTYARDEVARRYEREGQLLTEHALLEDDGDGAGSLEPSATGEGDGALAAAFPIGPPTGAPGVAGGGEAGAAADPEVARLVAERTRLEEAVAALRARRDSMETDAYEARLETLLVELAGVTRALRDAGDDAESGDDGDDGGAP